MYNRIQFLISLLFLAATTTFAQTNVSGTISGNVTWTSAGSPYIITGNVTIANGVTLTINSGVTVKFNQTTNMYVLGSLNANGSTFTSNASTPNRGDWGLTVGNNSVTAASLTADNCSFSYYTQINLQKGSATLTNGCFLSQMLYSGIAVGHNSGVNISNSSIVANNSYNLNFLGIDFMEGSNTSSYSITNCTISGFGAGVRGQKGTQINLSGSTISNCTYPIQIEGGSIMNISNTNTYSNNTYNAVLLYYLTALNHNAYLPKLTIPYFVKYGINITTGGRLEIASGAILKIQNGYSINVADGKLIASADNGDFIYFTSERDDNWGGDSNSDVAATAPAVGNWNGIIFNANSVDSACVLNRVKLRYAGTSNYGGVSTFSASPTITNCEFTLNYYGVYFKDDSDPVFSNNTIGSSSLTPIALSIDANPVFNNNSFSFSDNQYDAIGIIDGTIVRNTVLAKRNVTGINNVTYLLLGTVTVPAGKTLTINKGITIKSFNYSHYIKVAGTLIANGTSDSSIVFTSAKDDNHGNPGDSNKDGTITTPQKGDWSGILFENTSTGSVLNYCVIKYASMHQAYYYSQWLSQGAVTIVNCPITISNCTFKDLYYGVMCAQAATPTIIDNDFVNITYTPIALSGSANPSFSGNTMTNVTMQALGLLAGDITISGNIAKKNFAGYNNITYVLLGTITVKQGAYLNVEPGVVIKYNNSTRINVEGGFRALGKANDKVVFTALQDDNKGNPFDTNGDGNATQPNKGFHYGIYFNSTADDAYNSLINAEILYSGANNEPAVYYNNAGGKLDSVLISDGYYGVFVNGNSNPTIDNTSIKNCYYDPIGISLISQPNFGNISFTANGSSGILIIDNTLSATATLGKKSIAGFNNIPYILRNTLTISSNGHLIIDPGVIVKFSTYYYYSIIVNGKLTADGNPNQKIVFTALADDSKGGDTNNDGNTSTPNKGSYAGISFVNTTAAENKIINCEISYGGGYGYLLLIDNSTVTVDSAILQQSSGDGFWIFNTSAPVISNTQLLNITNYPVKMSMFANPTFGNGISVLNVGYFAIYIKSETYSQNGTVPLRSFAGINNITYVVEGSVTVNSGTTITIPAGTSFKGGVWYVNGRLNVLGNVNNPVVFTDARDDSYGAPLDMNQNGNATVMPNTTYTQYWAGFNNNSYIVFNDVANDSSTIQNTIFRGANYAIQLNSASPSIQNCTFRNNQYGLELNGTSTPVLENSIFQDLCYAPFSFSLVSYPSSTTGNVITGWTPRWLRVKDETLTQDVTLNKRSFGGINNITYWFGSYTIGTSAILTLQPGITIKCSSAFYVYKGLMAEGGSTADSNIVFTSIRDDFYGGDSNKDSTLTVPAADWSGIHFDNQALDPFCKFKNVIIRYANYGINVSSASPSILNSSIINNNYGIYATGASNPVINYCDIKSNYYYGVYNQDQSFNIDARYNWWGNNSGPTHTSNAGGTGDKITNSVNYAPFNTTGSVKPLMGDVSLNGSVQAYDASLILKSTVGALSLTTTQQSVADVSGQTGITAYDAALVLQYVVNKIQGFPAELGKMSPTAQNTPFTTGNVKIESTIATAGSSVLIPVTITNPVNVYSLQLTLNIPYNAATITGVEFEGAVSGDFRIDNVNHLLYVSIANAEEIKQGALFTIKGMVHENTSGNYPLQALALVLNETSSLNEVQNGELLVNHVTGISKLETGLLLNCYPNPSSGVVNIPIRLEKMEDVTITIYNHIGQVIYESTEYGIQSGITTVKWNGKTTSGENTPAGSYFVKCSTNTQSNFQRIVKVAE